MALSRRAWLTFIFLVLAIALYAYGIASASHIPFELEAVLLPLDFMVGIPAAFYLVIVRKRRITPLAVLPVIWLGYGLSVLALDLPDAGILPALLAGLVPVEIAIALWEIRRITCIFKAAKAENSDPLQWFYAATLYLVHKETPARMMAAELSVWYYALFSWRKRPSIEVGEKAFSYHNAGGYMNMMLGLGLAFPVEIVAMHMLLAQWSVAAATVATLLSAYAAIWLIGDARARILRPAVLKDNELRIECGIQMQALIQLDDIAEIGNCKPMNVSKADKLNYGTFYQANVWITTNRHVKVRTLLGTKQVRAIGISLDDPKAFTSLLTERIGTDDRPENG